MSIRVALIGLSATAKTSWASTAHLPYLLSPQGRSKFTIVALLNSSVEAARAAIAHFDLPPTTTPYGDPAALAADPAVDLVVCNTRVDRHFETIQPSVIAGKAVFSEWPLAQDVQHARILVEDAGRAGGRSVVGLQGRVSPVASKVRAVLEEGRIGKVLSSEVRAFGGTNDREILPEGLAYFTQREVGGNVYTIGFAHVNDVVQSVVGDWVSEPVRSETTRGHFQLQRPSIRIRGPDGTFVKRIAATVPDLINVVGPVEGPEYVEQGATLSFRLRRGQQFPGDPALVWSINGEKGEIRVMSPAAVMSIQVGNDANPPVIEVHDFETDTVDRIEWEWADWQKTLPSPARNIGQLYEEYAEGLKGGKVRYATFADALARHEQLERFLEHWSA
ncbi:hypothetical protein B0T25DRAFT_263861 [Lasiosphaeria hispida]|uniref:Oxidoreductase family protein n=1 Tax=Lasiosphaeria hispida TaxID=260671 RepID=A0AAJ0HGU6_9PEZI|nr:hypothetical protein B0T25DRAFT_263861 [Lasiosphaeria hispida]